MACSAPRSVTVKGYWRTKPRKKPQARPAGFVVKNTRTGAVVSRHRTLTAAIREEKRLDRISFRAGRGRPYDAQKAS